MKSSVKVIISTRFTKKETGMLKGILEAYKEAEMLSENAPQQIKRSNVYEQQRKEMAKFVNDLLTALNQPNSMGNILNT